ncbi:MULTISPECIES: MarR family transcriptional regulator [unclassified Curtobacterium]|uniref:MarR family winged helix-turn-helix transcriptional regulator n=1 Tax=unclassified Curtobacterium TaxID=257496 RepID=UPI000D8F0DCC|nr:MULTISPECIES: MarR family transcriptional regulator [unclassified Curtobacterium]PYY55865.1 MarR family transcriptional regulator [Curtobacterium sp. MCSS17_011]WIE79194.1 MarR family transcriptional regulator [Curtobacterium sp. MCSS17_016]
MSDGIDDLRRQWAQIAPELDTSSVDIVGRILRLAQILHARMDAALLELGLTRGEFDILSLLLRSGRALTASDLATGLHTSPAGTTKRIKKLVANGFATRQSHPADARSVLVAPTPATSAVVHTAVQTLFRVESDFLHALPQPQRAGLVDALRQLLVHAEQTQR